MQNRWYTINRASNNRTASSGGNGTFSSNLDEAEGGGVSSADCSVSCSAKVCRYSKYAAAVCVTTGAGYGVRALQDAAEASYCADKPSAWKTSHRPFDTSTSYHPH